MVTKWTMYKGKLYFLYLKRTYLVSYVSEPRGVGGGVGGGRGGGVICACVVFENLVA